MTQLKTMLKWEFILQSRYKIIHLSILSVVLYFVALKTIPFIDSEYFRTVYLFLDPALIGIMFVGALVLFEKTENTLQALTVTPMKMRNYFLAKIISLTLLSVVAATLFLFLVHGLEFNYLYMFLGIILTSVFLILLGFILSSRCNSINQYLLNVGAFNLVLFIPPMLHLSGLYQNVVFYLWPSLASFFLLKGVFSEVALGETIYSVAYLALWATLCYYLAKRAFYKHIVMGGE